MTQIKLENLKKPTEHQACVPLAEPLKRGLVN